MEKLRREKSDRAVVTRRQMLRNAAASAVVGAVAAGSSKGEEPRDPAARKGRVKQSLIYWCYQSYWPVEEMAKVARDLGCLSIELIDPQHWNTLKKYGLTCATAGS